MVCEHRMKFQPTATMEEAQFITRRRSLSWLGALGAPVALAPLHAAGQAFPGDTLTLVVPFSGGSPPDLFSRIFSEKLAKRLGRSVIVDLRPGASTTIGTAYAARAKPNGHTLLYATNSSLTAAPALFKKLQYNPMTDFSAVTVMLESYFCIVVRPEDAGLTLEALAKRIRANPGANAMAGGSTTAEVANKLFQNAAKLDHSYVRYNSNHMYTDLVGGSLNAVWAPLSTAMSMVKQSKMHIVAITGPQRLAQLPDTPTMAETYPGAIVDSWSGIFVPAATPRAIVNLLHGHVTAVLNEPEIVERGRIEGNKPLSLTPEQSDAYVKNDFPRWRSLLKTAGIEPA